MTNLFLRIYAMNLRRTWRSAPDLAWSDAVHTIEFLVGFPLAVFIFSAWGIASAGFPATIQFNNTGDGSKIAILIAVWVGVHIPLSMRLSRLRDCQISPRSFNSPQDRMVLVLAWILASVLTVLFVFAGPILRLLH